MLQPPKTAHDYVHLSGRTGRLGAHGTATVFATEDEVRMLNDYETILKIRFRRTRKKAVPDSTAAAMSAALGESEMETPDTLLTERSQKVDAAGSNDANIRKGVLERATRAAEASGSLAMTGAYKEALEKAQKQRRRHRRRRGVVSYNQ